jgi:hypothetical protein
MRKVSAVSINGNFLFKTQGMGTFYCVLNSFVHVLMVIYLLFDSYRLSVCFNLVF